MTTLVAFLRPISLLLGAGISQLSIDMASGKVPIPQDAQWSVQILIAIMIAGMVGTAQWLSSMSATQTYQQIIDAKDEQIVTLLALIRQDTAHVRATITNLPIDGVHEGIGPGAVDG